MSPLLKYYCAFALLIILVPVVTLLDSFGRHIPGGIVCAFLVTGALWRYVTVTSDALIARSNSLRKTDGFRTLFQNAFAQDVAATSQAIETTSAHESLRNQGYALDPQSDLRNRIAL